MEATIGVMPSIQTKQYINMMLSLQINHYSQRLILKPLVRYRLIIEYISKRNIYKQHIYYT